VVLMWIGIELNVALLVSWLIMDGLVMLLMFVLVFVVVRC